jgi:CHAT domain-containing protein
MLANAAQQPELPEDDETYQHEQQEVYNPMIEQQEAEQEIEQMPMMQDHDLNQLNLPDVIQNEVQ